MSRKMLLRQHIPIVCGIVVVIVVSLWAFGTRPTYPSEPMVIQSNRSQFDSLLGKEVSNQIVPGDDALSQGSPSDSGEPREHCSGAIINAPEWTRPPVAAHLQAVSQDDKRLADHICQAWILPPFSGERHLRDPGELHYSQVGQSAYIDGLLQQRTGGFFVECGAADGEINSNSLFFEKTRGWNGLLIEANPAYFEKVVETRRHAYMLNACLSPSTRPDVLDFRVADQIGGLTGFMEDAHKNRVEREKGKAASIKLQCFPFAAIVRAMNISHIDYFSLDIEGAELEVLRTIPFDEIRIDVLSVEYVISDDAAGTTEKLANIKKLLIDRYGYKVASTYQGREDVIFTKDV